MIRHRTLTVGLIVTAAVVCVGDDSRQTAFRCLGRIKPRCASEIQASNWSVGAETMDRDYTIYRNWKSYLGPLGFKKARLQAGWAKTEKEKGIYDWAWLDEIVFDMIQQGVEPWMCLSYGNPHLRRRRGHAPGGRPPAHGRGLAGVGVNAWIENPPYTPEATIR